MSIEVSKSMQLSMAALDYRSMRQDMIASNIANADTPNYKPRDVSFENALSAKRAEIFHDGSNELKMAQTDSKHIPFKSETSSFKADVFFRDGHMARNDGNSVDIDVETTEMSKNSIMFAAIVQAMKKDEGMFRSVIEASQRVS